MTERSTAGGLLRFEQVVVSPYTDLLAIPFGRPYHRGGPDWPDWDHQVEARHRVNGRVIDQRPMPVEHPVPLSGQHAWAGAIVPHFGHQITDFSMRIMPTLTAWPAADLIFATDPALSVTRLSGTNPFFREILDWFGVSAQRVRILIAPARVEELVVAPQAEQFTTDTTAGTGPSTAHLDLMDELTRRRLGRVPRHGTVYVSRAAQHARLAGEAYLEDRLRGAGVTVMRPELLPLRSQLRTYASAERLIFAEGSAVHATQLLGRSLGHVTVIQRRTNQRASRHCIEPRAESFEYLDASHGVVHGASQVGQGAPYHGISVLDAEALLEGLQKIGVDLRGSWQSEAFAAARDTDVDEWMQRELSTERGYVPESGAFILETLQATGLGHLAGRVPATSHPASAWAASRARRAAPNRLRSGLSERIAQAAASSRAPGIVRRNAFIRSLLGNPLFDPDWYRDQYPDVRDHGINPYRHFLRHGAREGRRPNPFFDTGWYLRRNPDAPATAVDPTDHYRTIGVSRGSDPGPHFSTSWYLKANPDVADAGSNPLAHYIRRGIAEGRARSGPREPATALNAGAAVPTPWSARRINTLATALAATSYVEIGVAADTTFLAVTVADRTGVDPNFCFDYVRVSSINTRLIGETSDAFFAKLPSDQTFDLYFLDGLHTFAQTYRDLLHALAHAHQRTAILIDDTVPSDEFSALPNQAEALRARNLAGGTDGSWHGDTYKVAFAIHDLHPELDYRTIMGSGNPQTLVWQSDAQPRRARIGSIGRISSLTYADLQANLDVLRPASEREALKACRASVARRPRTVDLDRIRQPPDTRAND